MFVSFASMFAFYIFVNLLEVSLVVILRGKSCTPGASPHIACLLPCTPGASPHIACSVLCTPGASTHTACLVPCTPVASPHIACLVPCTPGAAQDQDILLVKRRNDNHSPGPVIRELVPSSHQRSELMKHNPLQLQQMKSENRGGHSDP